MIEHYKHILPKLMKVTAVTLGSHVYYTIDSSQITQRLRTHESVHVKQYNKLGIIRFLYRYLKEYTSYRLKGYTHYRAYYEISFEKEARKKEMLNG